MSLPFLPLHFEPFFKPFPIHGNSPLRTDVFNEVNGKTERVIQTKSLFSPQLAVNFFDHLIEHFQTGFQCGVKLYLFNANQFCDDILVFEQFRIGLPHLFSYRFDELIQ